MTSNEKFPQKPDSNIRSMVDRQEKRKQQAAQQIQGDPDLIDFSRFEDPETQRRTLLDGIAIRVITEAEGNVRCTPEAIAAEMQAFRTGTDTEAALTEMTHEQFVLNPAKYYVLADEYLKKTDAMAEDVLQANLRSDVPRVGRDAVAKTYRDAPTTHLISLLRRVRERKESNPHIEDIAFEYRRRRMNNELGERF